MLGFVKDISPFISVKTTKLNRGDIILACTDGLIQSHSLRGEQFGKERVQQAMLDNSTYPAQRMAQFTFDGLLKFMSKEMEDDVSILILKYESTVEYADQPVEVETTETETAEGVAESVGAEGVGGADAAVEDESVEGVAQTENEGAGEGLAESVGGSKSASGTDGTFAEEQIESEVAGDASTVESEGLGTSGDISAAPSADEPTSSDSGAAATEKPKPFDDPDLPDDLDLSDLDAMMKMAGL